MKVNPFKTTLYSSVLLAGLAATSVAAADEAKDATVATDTDATVSNATAESSANLVKTTGDAAVVTTVPGTEETTTTETATTVKTTTKAIAEVSNPDFDNAVAAAKTTAAAKIPLMLRLFKNKQLKMRKQLQLKSFLKIN